MFVVGTVMRVAQPTDNTKFNLAWPVLYEDDVLGTATGAIATRGSRDSANHLADALNATLQDNQ